MNEIIKILSKVDGGIVLDAATGKGDFITTLKQHLKSYTQIIGVDSSQRCVDYAQKIFPENNIEIFRMNLEDMQFEDSYFDTVCISDALHHIQNRDNVLSEMLRILKPKGLMLITEMYCDGDQTPAQETHILMHHWVASVDRLLGTFHQKTFTRKELQEIIKQLPLKNVHIADFYVPVDDPGKNSAALLKNCQDIMKRLKTIENAESLIAEGENIMNRIAETGFANACRLAVTGYKKEK
ncbi:MAG: class I SAM-dependent methyltransferase [Candidatus Cloacimonas sp.]